MRVHYMALGPHKAHTHTHQGVGVFGASSCALALCGRCELISCSRNHRAAPLFCILYGVSRNTNKYKCCVSECVAWRSRATDDHDLKRPWEQEGDFPALGEVVRRARCVTHSNVCARPVSKYVTLSQLTYHEHQ